MAIEDATPLVEQLKAACRPGEHVYCMHSYTYWVMSDAAIVTADGSWRVYENSTISAADACRKVLARLAQLTSDSEQSK